ncbi:uncharacterized protein LOC111076585 isoform X3 [Drosophila obscura]|nr:uncharacterized protein LOC111076585 isoform X3 [Drosophila obscura]
MLVLIEGETSSYRSTSTIVLMVSAWTLLILGFVFCCCAECCGVSVWRGKKRCSVEGLNDAERGGGGDEDGAGGGGVSASTGGSDRANHSDPTIEICRRCPPDYEAESLPSYTIVSGLPTYDDALEEFRKAGILLTPSVVPIIKIFECNDNGGGKEQAVGYSLVETNGDGSVDNISLNSATCNCGNASPTLTSTLPSYSAATAAAMALTAASVPQVIELSPEHLASLSQKRLSLQISFNNSVRRQSTRSGAVLRNNLLRSRAVGNTAGVGLMEANVTVASGQGRGGGPQILPTLHRSSSTLSLSNERQLLDHRLRHLHHRGSLY